MDSYAAAREAMMDDDDDLDYVEWCAESSFLLAREKELEVRGKDLSDTEHRETLEFLAEMTDNASRLYERVMDASSDEAQLLRAYIGMICALKFSGRDRGAEWYVSIYPPFNDALLSGWDLSLYYTTKGAESRGDGEKFLNVPESR